MVFLVVSMGDTFSGSNVMTRSWTHVEIDLGPMIESTVRATVGPMVESTVGSTMGATVRAMVEFTVGATMED